MDHKISLHITPFINRLKRKLRHHRDILKSKVALLKKEHKEPQDDVQTDLSYTPPHCNEVVHTGDQLVDHLANSAFALIEYRLNQDYGDYQSHNSLAPALNKQRLQDLLFSSHVNWAALADYFEHERYSIAYGLTTTPAPIRPLSTPWLDTLRKVVAILGQPVTEEQLLWGISECARRSRGAMGCSGVEQFVAWGKPFALGEQILDDLLNLPLVYPADRDEDRRRMRRAIERVRDRYFIVCERGRISVREEAWGI